MNYETMTKEQLIELLAEKDKLISFLAQAEAQARLSATLGWQRYENSNRLVKSYMNEFEARGLVYIPKEVK